MDIEPVNHEDFYGTFIFEGKRCMKVPLYAKWVAKVMVDVGNNSVQLHNTHNRFLERFWHDEIMAVASFGGYGKGSYRYYLIFFDDKPTEKAVIDRLEKTLRVL